MDWQMYHLVVPAGLVLLAFCRLLMVGLAVSLADKDTFADRSTREFVEIHWSDPLIPRRVVGPVASNLFFPLRVCRFFGILSSAVDMFEVNSC